ncbi:MAG: Asp-tRNA(Asn)/Glu-tRNA(Gln) amidotransferase subunit GatC [Gemmatimonadaceae bacterium]
MAVSHDDVRHVAELARLAVDAEGLDHLVAELNGILAHMEVLSGVDTGDVEDAIPKPLESTPLRSDSSGPLPLEAPRESFAPSMRDGFFVVPRIASHEDGGERSP